MASKGQPERNKSSFVSLVPYEGKSGKRTLGTRSGSTKLLAVAPLVPILPGDFLGIFFRATSLHGPEATEIYPRTGFKSLVRLFCGDGKAV